MYFSHVNPFSVLFHVLLFVEERVRDGFNTSSWLIGQTEVQIWSEHTKADGPPEGENQTKGMLHSGISASQDTHRPTPLHRSYCWSTEVNIEALPVLVWLLNYCDSCHVKVVTQHSWISLLGGPGGPPPALYALCASPFVSRLPSCSQQHNHTGITAQVSDDMMMQQQVRENRNHQGLSIRFCLSARKGHIILWYCRVHLSWYCTFVKRMKLFKTDWDTVKVCNFLVLIQPCVWQWQHIDSCSVFSSLCCTAPCLFI